MIKRKILQLWIFVLLFFSMTLVSHAEKKTLQFGEYPQSEVKSEELIKKLEKITVDNNSEAIYEGERYRRVNQDDKHRWFKYEPVSWIILYETDENIFVMSERILDACNLIGEWKYVSWKDSLARTWLNSDFYKDAFTEKEKACIKVTDVKTGSEEDGYEISKDSLFYPSVEELENEAYGFTDDGDRKSAETEYAGFRGALDCYLTRNTWAAWFGYVNGVYAWNGSIVSTVSDVWWGARPCMNLNLSGISAAQQEREDSKQVAMSKVTVSLSRTSYTYDGKSKTPGVTVKYNGKKLVKSKDYSTKYKNNKYVGTASVVISGKGKYVGSITKKYTIKSPGKVKITLDANKGKIKTGSYKVSIGSVYGKLASATRKGYSFDGWYTKKKGGKMITATSYVTKKKNHTLYAHWRQYYTITYNYEGGHKIGDKDNPTRYDGSNTIVLSAPGRMGYTFAGWYMIEKDGSKRITKIEKGMKKNLILEAHWKPITYKIQFIGDKNTNGVMKAQTVKYGEKVRLTANKYSKAACIFAYWSTKADGTGKKYLDRATISNLSYSDGGIVKLYAQWKFKNGLKDNNDLGGVTISQSKQYKAYFKSSITNMVKGLEFEYSDQLFDNSTDLNKGLAKASIAVASAAYSAEYNKNIMLQLGFRNIKQVNYNKEATIKQNDFVAYTISQKRVEVVGERYNLIAVQVRGSTKNREWYSNFNIGTDGQNHQGFSNASKSVIKSIRSYYAKDCKNKVWITGHSRGAGVANLVAGTIAQEDSEAVGTSNIYAYTFATPSVNTYADDSLNCIYNFCNQGDIVTQVPLAKWGYKRYGKSYSIPPSKWSVINKNFKLLTNKNYQGYKNITDDTINAFYKWAPDPKAYKAPLIDIKLLDLRNPETLERKLGTHLGMYLAGLVTGNKKYITRYDIMHAIAALALIGPSNLESEEFTEAGYDISASILLGKAPINVLICYLGEDAVDAIKRGDWKEVKNALSTGTHLADAHCQELYYAWVCSL